MRSLKGVILIAAVLAGEMGANDFISICEHLAAVREDGRKPQMLKDEGTVGLALASSRE